MPLIAGAPNSKKNERHLYHHRNQTMTYARTARLFFLMLLVCLAASCKSEGKRPVVKIGYMICNSEPETNQRFQALTRYLSDKTGADCIMVPVDTHEFEQRFKSGEFAFTHTNSLLYVIL